MTTTATRRTIRVPSARIPRHDKRFGAGVIAATAVHAGLLVWLLLGTPGLDEYRRGIGTPGVLGGGGGGGGQGGPEVHYLTLPPVPSPARAAPRQPEPERVEIPTVVEPVTEVHDVEVPKPVVVATEPEPPVPTVTRPPRFEAVEQPGRGTGGGDGPGAGGGTGGGVGTGRGTGVGSGEGPGTGGDRGDVIAPRERAIVFPFEEAPPSSRGVTYTIRFYVDERGRPTRIEIEPEIADKDFRKKVMERMREWTFYAARTLDGRNVKGQYVTTYTP